MIDIATLSREERLRLIEQLWDSLSSSAAAQRERWTSKTARSARFRPEAELAIAKKRTPNLDWPLRLHCFQSF